MSGISGPDRIEVLESNVGEKKAELSHIRAQSEQMIGVFQRLGGRGYDDYVPGEVTKTTPSGDRTA